MKKLLICLLSMGFTTASFAVEPMDPFRVCANLSGIGSASGAVSCQQAVSQARYMSPYGAAACNAIVQIGAASSAVTCMQNIADRAFENQAADVCAAIAQIGAASAAATCAKNGAGKAFRPGELAACLSLAQTGAASASADCVGRSGYEAPVPGQYEQCPDVESILRRLHHARSALGRNNPAMASRVLTDLIYELEPCRQ